MLFCPDLIVYNGRIYHPEQGFTRDTALMSWKHRIVLTGEDKEILAYRCSHTRVINARGLPILPGFSDSHIHFLGYVRRKLEIDLSRCATVTEALELLRERATTSPPGSWIVGGGWDKERWQLTHFPHKKLLDAISTRHFIALESRDWHTYWVNSPVLQLLHIDAHTPDPAGGVIQRDSHGDPTGILQENATLPVREAIPLPEWNTLQAAFRQAQQEMHRLGLTSIHSMETAAEFRLYRQALRKEVLNLRVFWYVPASQLQLLESLKLSTPFGSPWIQISGIKIFSDGALGSQSAWMLENYRGSNHRGIAAISEEELTGLVETAVKLGVNCAVHAIGDAANRMVLQVFARFSAASRQQGLRHRIEHAQLVHPDDFPLFGKAGVIASVQPIHLPGDRELIERYWGERGRYAYAFGSLLQGGARLVLGSDAPIYPFQPWHNIYAAVQRHSPDDSREPFHPGEAITLPTALAAYTSQSAYAVHRETELGSIRPGMLADFFIPDRDITAVSPGELAETHSLLTVVNGKIVWNQME